ncbi:amidohydrolase family protein [Hydrogenophaga flava]|uniref:amidohydrolase family protein n=1 Tax=Hydrogenophaga flava TaxID=65657 RepID=UPI0008246A08|nr:amidohydrolase family protein [Hydrogenophaga flava]
MSHVASLHPCGCGIDVHAHIVPASFPAYLGRTVPSPWPSTGEAPDARGLCHRHVLVNGRHYRTVDERCWSAPRRLADMDRMELAMQVVSPMPELLSYWLDLGDAQGLIRFLNEQTTAICADSGGRLLGLAAVPLQDVDAAIAELRHAVEALGLVGVEIGSNVNGVPVGDARFDPFFAACVALDVPVFVHALKPTGMDRLVGPAQLQQVLAYPGDVGLAAASVITGGLLQRLPDLRLAFSHGGGTLSALLPRLQQGWEVFPALRESIPESPRAQAARLFYDTLVFDAPTLRHLLHSFGAQSLMLGTDHPFNFHEPRPLDRLTEAGLDTATREALALGNAQRFLGRYLTLSKESS